MRTKRTEKQCAEKGYRVQFLQGDMAEEKFCRWLVEAASQHWGKVNYLVNNAFSFIAKGLSATRDDWLRMMSVGPMGYSTMVQCVVEPMKRRRAAVRSSTC